MRVGHLPPGAAEQMARSIESMRSSGQCVGVELMAGPGCAAAAQHAGERYDFDNIPVLPFVGCDRDPCCACDFLPVIADETRSTEKGKSNIASWKKRLAWFGLVWVVIVSASLFLSGCATFPPSATTWVACDGARCDALWSRSQVWLANNSQYRIQLVNDNIIQTFGPIDGVGAIAYTVTKEKQTDGKTKIVVRGRCYQTVYGCMIDPAPDTNALYYELLKP